MKLVKIDLEKEDQQMKTRATAINSHMLERGKTWFSLADLRRLYESDNALKNEMFLLTHHGFIREKVERDITYYSIILMIPERLKQIEANLLTSKTVVERLTAELLEIQKQLKNWTTIKLQCEKLPKIVQK